MTQNLIKQVIGKEISPEQFEKIIWELSKGMTRKAMIYRGSELNPIRIYRSRIFNSQEQLSPFLDDYSYPPIEKCKVGRANAESVQVFYASAGGPTTFVESRCKVGDIIVISEYRSTSQLLLQEIGFSNSQNQMNEYEKILHEIFTHPTIDYYEYSSKIATHLMNGDFLNGITYPSIISNNQSQNLALKVEYVNKFLSLIHCTAYKVKSIDNEYRYEVEEINFGTNNGGLINWKGRSKQWNVKENGGELELRANGWQWEAYDVNNKLVDPE